MSEAGPLGVNPGGSGNIKRSGDVRGNIIIIMFVIITFRDDRMISGFPDLSGLVVFSPGHVMM